MYGLWDVAGNLWLKIDASQDLRCTILDLTEEILASEDDVQDGVGNWKRAFLRRT